MVKKKVEELTIGLESKIMYMKVSSKLEKDMEEVRFGGQMGAGTKEGSEKACNKDREFFAEQIRRSSIKVNG